MSEMWWLRSQELADACMQEDPKQRPSFEACMAILRPHVPMVKIATDK